MPLFGSRTRSPQDLVRSLQESLAQLARDKGEKETKRASEELTKTLQTLKNMVYASSGDQDSPSDPMAQLAAEMHSHHILPLLVNNLHRIHFEGRKDVVVVFNNLVRKQVGARSPTVEYISSKPELLLTLVRGYETHEVALNCGQMLRECCRAQELVRFIMNSEDFYKFFDYVELSTFEIASDAFSTFKDIITRHKPLSAEFLEKHYDRFFENYKQLLASDNYVTRRQALKLLGELLLERHNFAVMTRYISNTDNLKVMMTLLKEKSRNIQFEAFHVFKVFVANPTKPQPILDILLRNRDKLVDFLSKFHSDRSEDEQFNDEKAYLIKQIKELRAAPGGPDASSPAGTADLKSDGAS